MTWIYLEASTSLLGSVESRAESSGGQAQWPIVSKTDSAKPPCCLECGLINFRERPFGTTCGRCGEVFYLGLTSSPADFPAKTLAVQAAALAWAESGARFSSRLSDLQRKLARRLSSSKTSQQLELADFVKSSEHLPKWGMTVGGLVLLPRDLEHGTSANAGFYLPTLTASRCGTNQGGQAGRKGKIRPSLETMAREGSLPTIQARDYRAGSKPDSARMMRKSKAGWSMNLNDVVLMLTLRASEATRGHAKGRRKEHQKTLSQKIGGYLNPKWAAWFMGLPCDWISLEEWAGAWFVNEEQKARKAGKKR